MTGKRFFFIVCLHIVFLLSGCTVVSDAVIPETSAARLDWLLGAWTEKTDVFQANGGGRILITKEDGGKYGVKLLDPETNRPAHPDNIYVFQGVEYADGTFLFVTEGSDPPGISRPLKMERAGNTVSAFFYGNPWTEASDLEARTESIQADVTVAEGRNMCLIQGELEMQLKLLAESDPSLWKMGIILERAALDIEGD